jgi:nitrite reductase/ring-hydroxylating ferredoxin subunit
MDRGEIRRVTVSVRDLSRSVALYSGLLGMKVVREWSVSAEALADESDAHWLAASLGLSSPAPILGVDLEQIGTSVGAVRLVCVGDGLGERINEGARPYDRGHVKNLDFFTDDVRGQYARFVESGFQFLAPPVDYAVPWGKGAIATEAHAATEDGVKIALAKMAGVPRIAMGRSGRESAFTEVAAATQIVEDFDRAEGFYCDVLDLVPAAPTVIEGELIDALHLPRGTRLRMSFISGHEAAGGRVGLVSYEGEGVADARDLSDRVRAPYRGVLGLTFEVEDVERSTRRALALGAVSRKPPSEQRLGDTVSFGATVVSPEGIPIQFEARDSKPQSSETPPARGSARAYAAVCPVEDLKTGSIREHRFADGSPRVAVANVAGQVFAFEDRCPHLGGPLSRGEVRGRTLVCPWHGWMIDMPTGQVKGGRGAAVRPCGARIRDGVIEVQPVEKAT